MGDGIRMKAKRWFLYFVIYSMLGWCYEVFLEVVVYRWGFSNRGFLWGPYCPVYGFGALAFLLCLNRLKEKQVRCKLPFLQKSVNLTPLFVFVGIILIATGIELVASYLLEYTTGGWLWDYRSYGFHFQGRIALNPSLRFGLGGMVIMYLLHPALRRVFEPREDAQINRYFWVAAIAMGADVLIRIAGLIL